jgi:hypothetical protein
VAGERGLVLLDAGKAGEGEMSRTALPRHESRADYYPTPGWCVRRLLEAEQLPGGRWCEPAVGDGAIVRAVDSVRDDIEWTTFDIRPEVNPGIVADFTMPMFEAPGGIFDVIITNPPFSQAAAFVTASRYRAFTVVMLLRLGWLASQERHAMLYGHEPDVYVLPNRPCFDGHSTDSTDYAWMIWRAPRTRPLATLQILNTTPASERRSRP